MKSAQYVYSSLKNAEMLIVFSEWIKGEIQVMVSMETFVTERWLQNRILYPNILVLFSPYC